MVSRVLRIAGLRGMGQKEGRLRNRALPAR
jgi:hypothetical protein